MTQGKAQDLLVDQEIDVQALQHLYLTEENLEKVKRVILKFSNDQEMTIVNQSQHEGDAESSILELREESTIAVAAPSLTQFESEVEAVVEEINAEGLQKVAKRRGILLTKSGKVDKRTKIGRVLF